MINGAPAVTAPSSTGQSHDAKGGERRAFVTSYTKDNPACAKSAQGETVAGRDRRSRPWWP